VTGKLLLIQAHQAMQERRAAARKRDHEYRRTDLLRAIASEEQVVQPLPQAHGYPEQHIEDHSRRKKHQPSHRQPALGKGQHESTENKHKIANAHCFG
jgi:hypothetical protein